MAKVINVVSQEEIEVPAGEAQKGIMQGRYLPTPGRTQVVHNGRVGTVPSENVQRILNSGARLIDPEEAEELKIRREESDLPSQALGAAESVVSGMTLGGSRVIEEALGVDPRRMEARESDAAEIVGALAPGLVTGGAGFGASAARTAGGAAIKQGALKTALKFTPAGIVSQGARQLERQVAGAVGSQGVRKAIPLAAGQFVEGTAYGTGAEIDESVLGQREINAENIAAAGILSTALGGGFGAATGVIQRGANRAAQRALGGVGKGLKLSDEVLKSGSETVAAAEEIVQRHLGNVSAKGQVPMPDWLAKVFSGTSGLPIDDVKALNRMWQTPEGQELLLLTRSDRAARTLGLSEEIGKHVGTLNDTVTDAIIHSEGVNLTRGLNFDFNAVRASKASTALESALIPSQEEIAATMREILETRASGFGASSRSLALGRKLEEANAILEEARAVASTERLMGKGAEETFKILDQTQRRMRLAVGEMEALVDDGAGLMAYDRRAIEAVRKTHAKLKGVLGDENLFGEAAARLKRRDVAQAAAIEARARAAHLSPAVKRILKRDAEFPATSDDLLSVARRVGRHNGAEDAIDSVFDAELRYLSEIEGLDNVADAKITKAREARSAWTKMVEKRRQDLDSFDLLERERAVRGNDSPSVGVNSTLGPLLGTLLGGPIGGVVGYALTSPAMVAKTLANLKRVSAMSGARVDGAVGKLFAAARGTTGGLRYGVQAARKGVQSARRSLLESDRAGRLGVLDRVGARTRTQTSIDSQTRTERREDAERARQYVAFYATRPGLLAEQIAANAGLANDHAPFLTDALALKSEIAVQFLQTKVPTSYQAPFSNRRPIVDPVSWRAWEKYVEAVANPLDCIDKIPEGRFSVEHAEALREVYPEIYQSIRASVLEELAAAADEGRTIPLRIRMQMGIILQLPTDFALSPEGFHALQAVHREEASQQRTSSGPSSSNRSTHSGTPAEQTEI